MKYFKNTELAELYHISEKSVRNWIDAAEDGKLKLQLYDVKGKPYIANTPKNTSIIEQQVEKGKKYRNLRSFKVLEPQEKFYKIYNQNEIFDIIQNLDFYREIPNQYSYYNSGAEDWNDYSHKLIQEDKPNLLTNTINLLGQDTGYLEGLTEKNQRINIIDIGVGNGMPVRKLVEHFVKLGKLNRYIGIDISQDMLDIAERNFHNWFGDKFNFEGYIRDISFERIGGDLLAQDAFNADEPVANIFLFLGSTLPNFRNPSHLLFTIHESMGNNDVFVFAMKPDSPASRRYFDFGGDSNSAVQLSLKHRLVLELLNIDDSLYEVEAFFDERSMERRIQIRLNVAVSIKFHLSGSDRIIQFHKDDVILIWRHKQLTDVEVMSLFNKTGFELLQATKSRDQDCLLTISKAKADT